MAPPVLRPENAIKRAEELISVGEEQAALQSLYDFITARRVRWAQPSAVEPIVIKFLELGIELKKGRLIKDGLHQYKKLVQGSAEGLASVGTVARNYVDLIEAKLTREQAKQDQKTEVDDDLEGGITPENLLSSVYEEDHSVGGFNDEALNSWMRFAWESYRTLLDLLRNNSQLEITYSGVVSRTMQFCLKNNRKNEFKRLADMLRQHLDAANYQQSKAGSNIVDLSDSATLQRYLDQRFQLVNVSVKLELWHGAFRSIEDVFHLMKMSKKSPKASVLANYYQNLAKVFFVSGDQLLHTIAWKKFYELYSSNPNATEEQFKEYSSIIALSALAIKLDDLPAVGYDSQLRLYRLLDLDSKPNRKSIIASIVESELYSKVDDEVKELFKLLETDFNAETIKSDLTVLLNKLSTKSYFEQYSEQIRDVIVRRLLVSASIKFTSVNIDELYSFISLPAPMNMPYWDTEKALLQAAVEDYVSFNIDHEANTVTFIKDPFEPLMHAPVNAEDQEENEDEEHEDDEQESDEEGNEIKEISEGQETEEGNAEPEGVVTRNSYIRNKLTELSKVLNETDNYGEVSYMERVKLARENLIQQTRDAIDNAKRIAEERAKKSQEQKQKYMKENAIYAEQDAEVRQQRVLEEKAAVEAKLADEAHRRLIEKKKRELEEMKQAVAKQTIAEVNAKGHVYIDPAEATRVDLKDLTKMIVAQLSKDKDELEERMEFSLKKLDHTERALRMTELPILQKEADLMKDADEAKYNQMKEKIIEAARVEHEGKLQEHERLVAVYDDYKTLKNRLVSAHDAKFEAARKEMSAKFEAAKAARIEEVRKQRYDELVAKRRQEIAAAEREKRMKSQEEILRKQREVEEALERKSASNRTASRIPVASAPVVQKPAAPIVKKSSADLDEIARKQRAVEEMLEKKAAGQVPASSPSGPDPNKKLSFAEKMKLRRQNK